MSMPAAGLSGAYLSAGGQLLTVPGALPAGTPRWESFLLRGNIASSSGITFATNRPVKYGGNPAYGDPSWTWDRDVDYVYVYTDPAWPPASRYRMISQSDDGVSPIGAITWTICYAYSADGLTWVKPTVGRVAYGGSTANNIILPLHLEGHGFYNPRGAAGQQWLFLADDVPGYGGLPALVYAAATPDGPYTLYATEISSNPYRDAHALLQRPDGRWLIYYQIGYQSNQRQIGAWLSTTSDLVTSGIYDQGIVIGNSGSSNQKYTINVYADGGLIYAFVSRYNAASDRSEAIELYVSPVDDGLTFTQVDTDYIDCGSVWDTNYVYQGAPVRVGDEWWHYYSGATAYEHSAPPFNNYLGIAKIGYGRIGQISGPGGTLTTTACIPSDDHLFCNADASAGGARVDAGIVDVGTGSILPGYALADCDGLTGNTVKSELTWGGGARRLPRGRSIQITVALSGAAILYGYMIGTM